LEQRGVLVRHGESFGAPDHLRITVGTSAQLDHLLLQLDNLTRHRDGA
jgi:histidinol-phosphate/aromatic aminotransferase/cobyric acid decarboxylase-like protein